MRGDREWLRSGVARLRRLCRKRPSKQLRKDTEQLPTRSAQSATKRMAIVAPEAQKTKRKTNYQRRRVGKIIEKNAATRARLP